MARLAKAQRTTTAPQLPRLPLARRRYFLSMAISTGIHGMALLVLALWVLPSLVGGGKKVIEVSWNEDDSFALNANDFVFNSVPDIAESDHSSFETPTQVDEILEFTALPSELLQPTTLASVGTNSVESIAPATLEQSLASSGSVEDAVDRITGELNSKLEKGDLLVVWMLDSSNSLVDDHQRVAARLTPFYEKLAAARGSSQHLLQSVVVSFGALMKERVAPTEFGKKVVNAVEALPVDRSGKEQVFEAVKKSAEHYRDDWPKIQIVIVIWTDESGDDIHNLEPAIATCRERNVSVSVVGPSSVLGAETGLHAYIVPSSNEEYQLPVLRGPDSAMPERLQLGYWYLTRFQGSRRGQLPTWLGGQDLEGILSGYSPYALTRLAMQTGGQFTIFDRPEDRGPFEPSMMRDYAPSYGSMAEYRADILANPLRRAVLTAVAELEGKHIDSPPLMLFTKKTGERFFDFMRYYYTPMEFQAKLKSSSVRLKSQASRAAKVVEASLLHVSSVGDPEKGLDESYFAEKSRRWRAWYDLTRGRLLATSIRLEEYRLRIDTLSQPGALASSTNHVMLVAAPDMLSDERFQRRAGEAQKLLERCVYENRGTPWEMLAQRELDFALGVGVREMALTFEPMGPDAKQPNLPRF